MAGQWWRTPLIPALGRQRQADLWVRGQSGLQNEFQDSQGNPVSKTNKQTNKQTNKVSSDLHMSPNHNKDTKKQIWKQNNFLPTYLLILCLSVWIKILVGWRSYRDSVFLSAEVNSFLLTCSWSHKGFFIMGSELMKWWSADWNHWTCKPLPLHKVEGNLEHTFFYPISQLKFKSQVINKERLAIDKNWHTGSEM